MAEPERPTTEPVQQTSASTRGRQLGIVAVLAVVGAALAAVAAGLTWWSADYSDPLTGPVSITLSGAACVPELIPLALVGLAGFGAALATRGIPRRLIGVVLALCGATLTARSALSFESPAPQLASQLSRPADPVGVPQLHAFGPLLAVVGGLFLLAAGMLIALGAGARQRLGARYDAPAGRRPTPASGENTDAANDPADWWKALDAGTDPTATTAADSTDESASSPAPTDVGRTAATRSDRRSEDGYDDPNASRLS
jgi:uncharacterized membrane protein (TIGR02234 family)